MHKFTDQALMSSWCCEIFRLCTTKRWLCAVDFWVRRPCSRLGMQNVLPPSSVRNMKWSWYYRSVPDCTVPYRTLLRPICLG